jgi:hypothetical protein
MSDDKTDKYQQEIPLVYRVIDRIGKPYSTLRELADKALHKNKKNIHFILSSGKEIDVSPDNLGKLVNDDTISPDELKEVGEVMQAVASMAGLLQDAAFLRKQMGLAFNVNEVDGKIRYESRPSEAVQNIRLQIRKALSSKSIEYGPHDLAIEFVAQRTDNLDPKAVLIISKDLFDKAGFKEAIQGASRTLSSSYMYNPGASKGSRGIR